MKAPRTIARIFPGFGVAIVFITMALVSLAWIEMQRINATATRITGDTMPSIYLSGQLQSATLLRYTLLTDYVDPNNQDEKAVLDRQIASANAQIDDVMSKLKLLIDSPEDERLFNTLKATRAPYDECYISALRLSRQGQIDEAQTLIGTQLIPLRNAFLKAAEAEVVSNKTDGDDAASAIMEAVNWTSTSILSCLVFGVGIAGTAFAIRKRLEVEKKLHQSEERFQKVFEQAADGIVITDTQGNIQFVNPAFTAMSGYSREEVLGRNPRMLQSGCMPAEFYKKFWTTILSGQVWDGEVINRRKDGSLYCEEMRVVSLRDTKNVTTGYIAIKHDVTEQRAAQDAQAFLAAIVEGYQDAIIAFAPSGKILTWNRGATAVFGYSAEEAIGEPISMLVTPERSFQLADITEHVLQGQDDSHSEGQGLRKDGRIVDLFITASPVRDLTGGTTAIAVVIRDITERRKSELLLRESEERFRTMADSSPSMMWVTDARGRIEFLNSALRNFYGIEGEEWKGIHWAMPIHPDDLSRTTAMFVEAMIERKPIRGESRVRRADGEWRLIGTNAEPRLSPDGQYLGHIGLCADITEREAARQQREFQHSLIRTIQEVSLDGILVVNDESKIVSHNQRFLEVWQIPSSKFVESQNASARAIPSEPLMEAALELVKDPERFLTQVRDLYADRDAKEQFEVELKDCRTLEIYSTSVRNEEDRYLARAWFARDITERKRAEQALHGSEEKFRQLAENITEVFWMMTAAGTEILYIGPAYEQIWGRTCKSLYQNPMDWQDAIHLEDREHAHQNIRSPTARAKTSIQNTRINTPDGQQRWIRDRAFPVRVITMARSFVSPELLKRLPSARRLKKLFGNTKGWWMAWRK